MDDLPPTDDRPDPYTKQREKIRREQAELDRTDTMLLTRPANEWHLPLRDRKAYSEELFGPLWHVGEVALLFGPRGVGKSILAVQIAESIARGRPVLPIQKGKSRRRGEKVLYVDMQRSEAQWAERYALPSPIPGKPPRRYRFSRDLLRAGIDLHLADPDAYRKDPHAYAQAAIGREIEGSGARIVIVDDILLGGANAACQGGLVRTMQTMRHWAMYYEVSILIVASAKQRRRPGPVTLADIAGSRQIADLADSVFALAPSTFGPQYRYIKHLASKSSPTYEGGVRLQPGGGSLIAHPEEVLTFQFGGVSSPSVSAGASSALIPQSAGRIPQSDNFLGSPHSSLVTRHSSLEPHLRFLGPSDELAHLVDYAAEALDREQHERADLRRFRTRSARSALIDGIIDGRYMRYLKGE